MCLVGVVLVFGVTWNIFLRYLVYLPIVSMLSIAAANVVTCLSLHQVRMHICVSAASGRHLRLHRAFLYALLQAYDIGTWVWHLLFSECAAVSLRLDKHERGVDVQVEHGITEMVNQVDLVAWQLKLQCPGFEVPHLLPYLTEQSKHKR